MNNPFIIKQAKKLASKKHCLIGTYVPEEITEYFALYSIYRGVAKSVIIEEILRKLVLKEIPIEQIIDRLSARAMAEWNDRLKMNIGKKGWQTPKDEREQREKCCIEFRKTLTKRGIAKKYIERILQPLVEKR